MRSRPLSAAVALAADAQDADLAGGVTVSDDGTALVWTLGPAGRSGVAVVDLPDDGSPAETAGVDLVDTEVDLALTAGGVLVAGDRPGGPPFLLLVDPVRGTVTSTAAIDVSDVAGPADRVQLDVLAVSPDGSRIAVALAVQAAGETSGAPAVAVLETDPFTPGDVVALDGSRIAALAVADGGVAYVSSEGRPGLDAVDPDAGTVRQVPGELGENTAVAVVGDQVVAVSRELEITRLDSTDGAIGEAVDLCAGAGLWVLPA